MLHFIRERAQGWIAWIIIGLLIIPFALWGINQYFDGGGQAVVATVNGTEISQQEFQQTFFEQRTRMQQMLGERYDSTLFEPQIKKRVLEDLVNRELLIQNADESGYRISDESVLATIRGIESFRQDGVFSAEIYRQQLQAQGQSPAVFERRVQRALLTSQLPAGLANTAFVTDAELDAIIRLQEQKRHVDYLVLPVTKYEDKNDASDDAVAKYYDTNRERYMTPEQIRVEYVELQAGELGKQTEPSEEELRKFYDTRESQFAVPEERQARHILIQVPEAADETTVKQAESKAQDILKRIRAGESFEDLAKANSDDPGSAQLGGDLGFFGRGVMEPDFETAVFALNKGDVSDPVLTSFGYHIIKLEDIHAEQRKSYDAVKDELREQYRKEEAEREFFDLSEKLTILAYETPDSLTATAEKLGLKLKESPFIPRSGAAGLFANPRLVDAAFSDEVLKNGYNSEPIEIGENHVVVLRMKEHQEAAQKQLAEVKDQIVQQLLNEKAGERVKETGASLIKRLMAGESMDVIAQELKLQWQQAGEIGRSGGSTPSVIASQAFRLQKPAEYKPSFGNAAMQNGDFALIAVSKVIDGDTTSLDQAARQALRQRIANLRGAAADDALIATLKADAKVSIKSDDL
jgi:peptidyl-prolyl cis-trans isomerase D